MNYHQQKQQSALHAAKAQIAEDYGRAFEMYKIPEPEPSQQEIQFLLTELKILNLKQKASGLGRVVDMLERATAKKSSSCGCTGKSGSAGRYETKSMSSGTRQSRNYFAEHMGQICKEQYMDAEYTRFCEAYL